MIVSPLKLAFREGSGVGASLLSQNNCNGLRGAFNSSRSNVEIRLGEHNIWEAEGTEQHIMSAKFIRHPDYNSRTQDNDIMLIKLSQPATLNSYVRPATLPTKCARDGTMCQISGWGSLLSSNQGCELHSKIATERARESLPACWRVTFIVQNASCFKLEIC